MILISPVATLLEEESLRSRFLDLNLYNPLISNKDFSSFRIIQIGLQGHQFLI